MRTCYITQRPRTVRGLDERGDDGERTSERARENRGRRRIYIVQIYSRLSFGSLPILFSRAKAGSHCARANFVTDYRAVLVCVGGAASGARCRFPPSDSLRFRSRYRGNTREKVARSILRRPYRSFYNDPQPRYNDFDIFPINCHHPWPMGQSFADINSARKSHVCA